MNSTFTHLVVYNGYPLSVVAAVSFHLLVLALLIYFQTNDRTDSLELIQPTVVKALFIDENPQVVERQRLERVELQRIAEERRQREQQEAERQAEAERLRQEQERRRLVEEERERAALVERERLERQRELEAQREQDRLQREAEQRRRQETAEAERLRQEAAERRRRQEVAEAAVAQAARTEFELVQSGTAVIQQLLQEHWSRPPSARNGMRAILQIRMLPTGELLDVAITQSSGDSAFDRSAERAVYSAAPFSELQSLPINVFNANFRSLSLIFEPQDLLN